MDICLVRICLSKSRTQTNHMYVFPMPEWKYDKGWVNRGSLISTQSWKAIFLRKKVTFVTYLAFFFGTQWIFSLFNKASWCCIISRRSYSQNIMGVGVNKVTCVSKRSQWTHEVQKTQVESGAVNSELTRERYRENEHNDWKRMSVK